MPGDILSGNKPNFQFIIDFGFFFCSCEVWQKGLVDFLNQRKIATYFSIYEVFQELSFGVFFASSNNSRKLSNLIGLLNRKPCHSSQRSK